MSSTSDIPVTEETNISEQLSSKSDSLAESGELVNEPPKNELKNELEPNESAQNVSFVEEVEADEFDYCAVEQLLQRQTRSFRCLTQVAVSNSSLMNEKLYHFPPLEDPGIDEAYFFQESQKSYDNIGLEKYQDLCKQINIFPFNSVKRGLANETLNLRFYTLTPKQMKAVCETLAGNAYVENLILDGNHMTIEQTKMLKNMMDENTAIKFLNLRECRIGAEGAKNLETGILGSAVLAELDLSYNSLGDNGLLNLLSGLCETTSLRKINLSHNELTEDCAEYLEKILLKNITLREIDLSWNFLNTGLVCKKVFNAFLVKDSVTRLMFSWNGIGSKATVLPIAKYISHSEVLEYLDLSWNRLVGPPLRRIRGAIMKNHSLLSVKIGNNPYPPDEAYFIASLLTAKAKDPIMFLDMENIHFTKEILQSFGDSWGSTRNKDGIFPSELDAFSIKQY